MNVEQLAAGATLLSLLGGAVVSWHRQRIRLRMTVSIAHKETAIATFQDGPIIKASAPQAHVRLVNRGRPVTVECLGWVDPDVAARANHVDLQLNGPAEMPRNEGRLFELPAGELAERDEFCPLDFWVGLTDGTAWYAEGIRMMQPMAIGPQAPVRLGRWRRRAWRQVLGSAVASLRHVATALFSPRRR